MKTTEEVRQQSNEEWFAERFGDKRVIKLPVKKSDNILINGSEHIFHYVDHNTTSTNGGLVLEFESLDKSFKAVRFYNVKLESRGNKYPSGKRGQFIPLERSLFRVLWMEAVGKPPYRWSRSHKHMRSQFKSVVFIGKIKHEMDKKGNPYIKITDLRVQ